MSIRARDIMTTAIVTVSRDSTLKDIAHLLAEKAISGAPVVDSSGKLLGMVTEADLINREKINSAEQKRIAVIPRTGLFGFWTVPEELLREAYRESLALKAEDVMTSDVVTAAEDTTADQLADLMVKKRVNRIPILRDGELVGIVTRHDLLKGMGMGSETAS